MKNKNGGYALAYILVVVILISLVSLGIAGIAMSNLKSQSEGIDYMQSLYEAEGEVEEFWTKLYNFVTTESLAVSNGDDIESLSARITESVELGYLKDIVNASSDVSYYEIEQDEKNKSSIKAENQAIFIKVVGYSADKSVTVSAVIKLSDISSIDIEVLNGIKKDSVKLITSMNMSYESYEIITSGGGAS